MDVRVIKKDENCNENETLVEGVLPDRKFRDNKYNFMLIKQGKE